MLLSITLFAQQPPATKNIEFLKQLHSDTSYMKEREKIIREYTGVSPGRWGEFVKGVNEDIRANGKIVALTFDACGGPHSNKFDTAIINYLKKENIPATIFVTGRWIDDNYPAFVRLSKEPLFEIENHGLNHRPCSLDGQSAYGIKGTAGPGEAFDEIEANERKIEQITGRRPLFYRTGTAYINEACTRLAAELNVKVISYDVLSGDAIPYTAIAVITRNVLTHIKPGAIVIFHINHPEWNTYESLLKIIPALKKSGYSFARLETYPVIEKETITHR